jgi:hypothetical protein
MASQHPKYCMKACAALLITAAFLALAAIHNKSHGRSALQLPRHLNPAAYKVGELSGPAGDNMGGTLCQ